jgi:hypothetical protein
MVCVKSRFCSTCPELAENSNLDGLIITGGGLNRCITILKTSDAPELIPSSPDAEIHTYHFNASIQSFKVKTPVTLSIEATFSSTLYFI